MTLLTPLMLTLPICCSGRCPGASFHSGSRASPTSGSSSSDWYLLAWASRLARPGCRSRMTYIPAAVARRTQGRREATVDW